MQIPYHNGSPEPYGQPNGARGSSPYSQSPYQAPYSPPSQYGQGYGQPGYQPYTPPPQQTYGRPDDGYRPPAQYGESRPYEGQYGPPSHQNHSPYQQQSPYCPPGSQPPFQQGAAADYMGQSQQDPPPPPHPDSNSEEDRGVMGALAGGAAGAWAGHKVHHGFLGALGGAFAGHKLQDAVHDHNKHKKDEEKHHQHSPAPPPPHHQQQHQQQQHQQRSYAGNFTASCTQVSLDGDFDLIASCGRIDGSRKLSSISLNRCLTNSDGHLRWARDGNFAASARNVRIVDGGRLLEAELKNCGGHWVWDRIVLDEKISNEDGNLVMV